MQALDFISNRILIIEKFQRITTGQADFRLDIRPVSFGKLFDL